MKASIYSIATVFAENFCSLLYNLFVCSIITIGVFQRLWLFFQMVIMMTLYVKRDVSADSSCFVIADQLGEEKYRACLSDAHLLRGGTLLILDTGGAAVAKIRRMPLVGGIYALRFGKKHITFVNIPTPKGMYSYFFGSNWRIVGEVAAKNFSVIDVDKTLILEHRRYADYCALTIPDSSNELFCVALSVCANLLNTLDSPALQAV